ncbi:hypothetical protein C8J57DRAFT_1472974, partial [Mycena rebaudengoi]
MTRGSSISRSRTLFLQMATGFLFKIRRGTSSPGPRAQDFEGDISPGTHARRPAGDRAERGGVRREWNIDSKDFLLGAKLAVLRCFLPLWAGCALAWFHLPGFGFRVVAIFNSRCVAASAFGLSCRIVYIPRHVKTRQARLSWIVLGSLPLDAGGPLRRGQTAVAERVRWTEIFFVPISYIFGYGQAGSGKIKTMVDGVVNGSSLFCSVYHPRASSLHRREIFSSGANYSLLWL